MDNFIPPWAERTLSKSGPFDMAEHIALKDFYEAWEHLHGLPNDKLHRRQAEEAAQALVDKAHLLRRMKAERPVNGSSRGT